MPGSQTATTRPCCHFQTCICIGGYVTKTLTLSMTARLHTTAFGNVVSLTSFSFYTFASSLEMYAFPWKRTGKEYQLSFDIPLTE